MRLNVRQWMVLSVVVMLSSSTFAIEVKVPATATDVLTENSSWRWNVYFKKPTISVAEQKAAGKPGEEPLPFKGKRMNVPYTKVDQINGLLPPVNWQLFDYDDSGWPYSRLTDIKDVAYNRFSTMSVRLRGKFTVKNPSAVKAIYLKMKFYGGAVVYLNGKEIARSYLPKGKLDLDALADQYPIDVQVDSNGLPIPGHYERGKLAKTDSVRAEELEGIVEKRWRTLGVIKLDAGGLKAGENILAIELRRSHYPLVAKKKWFSGKAGKTVPYWIPIALPEVSLSAIGSNVTATVPSVGMKVWNEDINVRVTYKDYGLASEKLKPVKLIGAKNGLFVGQVVVGSDSIIKGLKVKASPLKARRGGSIISAKNIEIFYALPSVKFYSYDRWFDALQKTPIAEIKVDDKYKSAVQPVVVRVNVPKGVAAGDYSGLLVISAMGEKSVSVPVNLHVANWTIPDPKKFRTYVGIYESPISVALQYDVPMWSEKHWALLEKSIEQLARVGNKMVNIPVVDKTQLGNDDGWIYWVKQANGSYKYDFTVFDRYMKLVLKHCGAQEFVAMQIWHAGGWHHRPADQQNSVTVIDAKTGKKSHLQVPPFNSSEAVKFWKPLLDQLQARLKKLDMPDAMCIGTLSDSTAPSDVFATFDKIMPPVAKWQRGLHTQNRSPKPYKADKEGGIVVLHEHCYGLNSPDPDKKLPELWNLRERPAAAYDRISNHEIYMSLLWFRGAASQAIFYKTRGVGRICLDFWPVLHDVKRPKWDVTWDPSNDSGGRWVYNRWERSTCMQRRPSLQKLTWAGLNGAETTIRYELFIEGLQETEAIIYISEAVSKHANKLGPALVKECNAALADKIRVNIVYKDRLPIRPYYYGWQDVSARLYECAAKIDKKL